MANKRGDSLRRNAAEKRHWQDYTREMVRLRRRSIDRRHNQHLRDKYGCVPPTDKRPGPVQTAAKAVLIALAAAILALSTQFGGWAGFIAAGLFTYPIMFELMEKVREL